MKLLEFYTDKEMMNEVKALLESSLESLAVERARAGKSTTGIKEAFEAIEKTWYTLDQSFGEDEKPQGNSSPR